MNPNSVRFTQESVRYRFKDGSSIDDLADALRNGRIRPEEVPPLRLVEIQGSLFTLDNRRLVAFRRAGQEIPWTMATPEEVLDEAWKFTTKNEGISVRIRGE